MVRSGVLSTAQPDKHDLFNVCAKGQTVCINPAEVSATETLLFELSFILEWSQILGKGSEGE